MSERMNLADAPDVLTVEQTAALLAVGRGTAYEAIRAGEIPSVRIGRCIRVPRHALEELLMAAGANSLHKDGTATNGAVRKEVLDRNEHSTEQPRLVRPAR